MMAVDPRPRLVTQPPRGMRASIRAMRTSPIYETQLITRRDSMQIDQKTHSSECHALCSIIPPHVFDHLAKSDDTKVRQLAIDAIAVGSAARAVRSTLAMMPGWAAVPSPAGKRHRLVYDVKHGNFNDLP